MSTDLEPTTTTPEPRSVVISRQLGALYQAWKVGAIDDAAWTSAGMTLRGELIAAAAAEAEQLAGDPFAVDVPVVVAGELIESAWGNQVRTDLLEHETGKVGTVGSWTMAGSLDVNGTINGNGPIAANQGVAINAAAPVGPPYAPRTDRVVAKAGDIMTGDLYQTRSDLTVGHGAALRANGGVHSTMTGAGGSGLTTPSLVVARGTTAAGIGAIFESFRSDVNPPFGNTIIGSITQNAAAGVAYNTVSDKRLKTPVGPVDPADAVDTVARIEPIRFTWTDRPDAGDQIGFLAQDLWEVAPEAVSPGVGEPGDDDFIPWGVDPAKLVPTLVAAIQALTARIAVLEAR